MPFDHPVKMTKADVELESVKRVEAKARLPGEIAGPAVAIRLRITNSGTTPIDLGGVTVNVRDGAGQMSAPLTAAPAAPLKGELQPGQDATGVYLFELGAARRQTDHHRSHSDSRLAHRGVRRPHLLDQRTHNKMLIGRKKQAVGFVTASIVAAGVLVATASSASAAPAPVLPLSATDNISADALPTVQIDGVVWSQAVVGNTVFAGGRFNNARPAGAARGYQPDAARQPPRLRHHDWQPHHGVQPEPQRSGPVRDRVAGRVADLCRR